MRDNKLPLHLVWESKEQIVASPNAYVLYNDTAADKNHSRAIKLVRRPWSGNTRSVIRGIGIVTCVYVNLELAKFWLIDYRIFAPDCAMLVWCRFKELADETGRTVYQIKFGPLSDYLIEQLKSPSVKMAFA